MERLMALDVGKHNVPALLEGVFNPLNCETEPSEPPPFTEGETEAPRRDRNVPP